METEITLGLSTNQAARMPVFGGCPQQTQLFFPLLSIPLRRAFSGSKCSPSRAGSHLHRPPPCTCSPGFDREVTGLQPSILPGLTLWGESWIQGCPENRGQRVQLRGSSSSNIHSPSSHEPQPTSLLKASGGPAVTAAHCEPWPCPFSDCLTSLPVDPKDHSIIFCQLLFSILSCYC